MITRIHLGGGGGGGHRRLPQPQLASSIVKPKPAARAPLTRAVSAAAAKATNGVSSAAAAVQPKKSSGDLPPSAAEKIPLEHIIRKRSMSRVAVDGLVIVIVVDVAFLFVCSFRRRDDGVWADRARGGQSADAKARLLVRERKRADIHIEMVTPRVFTFLAKNLQLF